VGESLHTHVWTSSSDRHFSELGHKILAEISEKWFRNLLTKTKTLNIDASGPLT